MSDLTPLERQAAVIAAATVQECRERHERAYAVYVIAVSPEGCAVANALWESVWSPLENETLHTLVSDGLGDCIRKRDTIKAVQVAQGACGDQDYAGKDVLV